MLRHWLRWFRCLGFGSLSSLRLSSYLDLGLGSARACRKLWIKLPSAVNFGSSLIGFVLELRFKLPSNEVRRMLRFASLSSLLMSIVYLVWRFPRTLLALHLATYQYTGLLDLSSLCFVTLRILESSCLRPASFGFVCRSCVLVPRLRSLLFAPDTVL